MELPALPSGENKPSWGGLLGAASSLYLLVDPYRRHAQWQEWLWTGLTILLFLALCTTAAIYWSRKTVMMRVCIATTVLATLFTAYRPSGIVLFSYVAAFVPFAVAGNILKSAAVILGIIIISLVEWWLMWPPSSFPFVFAMVSALLGAAITFVARQQIAIKQFHRTAERERIARDLHDILGHTLSVIILKSELASRLMDQNPQRAKSEIEDVERISRGALAEVREVISGYRRGDLRAEFDRARSTLETAGLIVEQQCDHTGMPASPERVLTLVLREAVTNVLRHAQAHRCRMTFGRHDGTFRLEVYDDGRGGPHREGLGMRGIRERIADLGGDVSWRSGGDSGSSGTAMVVVIPTASGSGTGIQS